MPQYLFLSEKAVPAGGIERFSLNHPGDVNAAIQYAKARGLGGPRQKFIVYAAQQFEHVGPKVLCVQISTGQGQNGQVPQTSAQHVNGGQPIGIPQGQPNHDRADAPVDPAGFQELGDGSLPVSGDSMYGDLSDGTITDLVQSPAGSLEVPRQTPQQ